MLLGRPWIHDMEAIPSTLHGKLKFEFQSEVHLVMGYPKPYALCNVVDFKYFSMLPSQYEREPLEYPPLRENIERKVQVT